MPNRIIREAILTSDKIDGLGSWAAEVFYRRLMSIVDDYGRFDGRASVIRSAAYPLKLNTVGDPDIGKWLDECESAGLVRKYTVNGKPYLELLNFKQQVRSHSRYPDPPSRLESDTQMRSKCVASEPKSEQTLGTNGLILSQNGLRSSCEANDHLGGGGGGGVFGDGVGDEGGGGGVGASATHTATAQPPKKKKGIETINFEPVRRDLFRREYEAMIADAQDEIDSIKRNPRNFEHGKLNAQAEADRLAWVNRKKEIRNAMRGVC